MIEGLQERPRRVIEQAFEAFAWRAEPAKKLDVSYLYTPVSVAAAEKMLAGVTRRELSDALYDLIFIGPTELMHFTTAEARLYYMPVLISRCVRDIERADSGSVDITGDGILWRFRYHPRSLPVARWPQLMDAAAGDKVALALPDIAREAFSSIEGTPELSTPYDREYAVSATRKWLMIGEEWRTTLRLVAQMTLAEKKALVALFDYFVATGHWQEEGEEPDIASAKALLMGRGVMDVLVIRTDAECMEIVDALTALETRHPVDFPPVEVAPLKNALLDIVAGRRSPDIRLGW